MTVRGGRARGTPARRSGALPGRLVAVAGAFSLWALVLLPLWGQNGGGAAAAEGDAGAQIAAIDRALEGEPAWLMLEKGRIAQEGGDLGAALAAFLEAKEAAGRDVFPEADMAIGDFWLAEGELAQAERSYRRAVDDLRIAENLIGYREYDYASLRFVLLERLAELYRLRENYGLMEEQYRSIVQADRDFSTGTLADRLAGIYRDEGLNKVLTLYRLDSGFAVRAYAELGWLYYRNGNYEKATPYSLFAVTNVLSTVIGELRRADPQYAFVSVEITLRDGVRRPNTRAYLEGAGIWKALYYLAATTYAQKHEARARETWEILSRSRDAGTYQGLAARQLARPWIEPPLKEPFRGGAQ